MRFRMSIVMSCVWAAACSAQIAVPMVTVDHPGNPEGPFGGGSVNHPYQIGTFEVTNLQYAAFLNAKARTGSFNDPLNLFNSSMQTNARGGITRSGLGTIANPFSYATRPNMADKPVNFVTWFDSVRFANWMSNGQGAGDTETGAYTLLGGTPTPTNAGTIQRNAGATVFLPTFSEWYKAGHYDPGADTWYRFATRSDSVPTVAIADATGGVVNAGPRVANSFLGADWNGLDGNVTTVGACGAPSPFGTYDQTGNVWEWCEDRIDNPMFPTFLFRSLPGASFVEDLSFIVPGGSASPTIDVETFGFRIASVPAPGAAALVVALLPRAARRRRH